jgi:histidinol-phosphate phosphatase family protein
MSGLTSWAVVIPTVGRPSLRVLLAALADQGTQPTEVVVVDDRAVAEPALDLSALPGTRVLVAHGGGPAHARNLGWRVTASDWVVFVDDDVVVPPGWADRLLADLDGVPPGVAGVQGRVVVPRPTARRPTDWERSTMGLERASWATADMAYRRAVLELVGGFDERFPRAYREDADLAHRIRRAGFALARGRRTVLHPVRGADRWVSVRAQRGNADDALMRRLHGRRWRAEAACPSGRLPWHAATVASLLVAAGAVTARRRRVAGVAAAAWATLYVDLTWRRVRPGPRAAGEVMTMAVTSVALPVCAVWHRAVGTWRHRRARPWQETVVRAVLFDRDGTLIEDEPYNGDPERVRPMQGACEALGRLRATGLRTGVVTNQSGVGLGLLTLEQVRRVNERVEELLGPFDTWQVCPHAPADGCRCRKPAPGMVHAAARDLGVRPERLWVVGDVGADVRAAQAAGAHAILVPNGKTRRREVRFAPRRAASLEEAVSTILRWPRP